MVALCVLPDGIKMVFKVELDFRDDFLITTLIIILSRFTM